MLLSRPAHIKQAGLHGIALSLFGELHRHPYRGQQFVAQPEKIAKKTAKYR